MYGNIKVARRYIYWLPVISKGKKKLRRSADSLSLTLPPLFLLLAASWDSQCEKASSISRLDYLKFAVRGEVGALGEKGRTAVVARIAELEIPFHLILKVCSRLSLRTRQSSSLRVYILIVRDAREGDEKGKVPVWPHSHLRAHSINPLYTHLHLFLLSTLRFAFDLPTLPLHFVCFSYSALQRIQSFI